MSLMVTLYKMIKVAALNLGTPSKSAYSKDASLQLELSCIYDNIFIYICLFRSEIKIATTPYFYVFLVTSMIHYECFNILFTKPTS
jgi:hypothetical protein